MWTKPFSKGAFVSAMHILIMVMEYVLVDHPLPVKRNDG